jgi:DNA-binding IscR family transcriptional regulator
MRCTEDTSACIKDHYEFCALREMLVIAEKRLTSVFEEFTLADLVEWQKTQVRPTKAN